MFSLRIILLFFVLILSFAWLSSSGLWKRNKTILPGPSKMYVSASYVSEKMKKKAGEAKKFASQNNFNGSICFLADMSLPSGQNRFFVYDLAKDSVQRSGLVTHGR